MITRWLGADYLSNEPQIIGASANVVTTGIAERFGHRITFYEYPKQAGPITLVSLIISLLFLLGRY